MSKSAAAVNFVQKLCSDIEAIVEKRTKEMESASPHCTTSTFLLPFNLPLNLFVYTDGFNCNKTVKPIILPLSLSPLSLLLYLFLFYAHSHSYSSTQSHSHLTHFHSLNGTFSPSSSRTPSLFFHSMSSHNLSTCMSAFFKDCTWTLVSSVDGTKTRSGGCSEGLVQIDPNLFDRLFIDRPWV